MLYKKIVPFIVAFFIVSCGKAPFSFTYNGFDYASKDNIVSELTKVMNISDKSERFKKTIELDKKMVDEGVFLPSFLIKGGLQKSRFYNMNYKTDIKDYKNLITFNEFIKNNDRDYINTIDKVTREDITNTLKAKGYTPKDCLEITKGYYFNYEFALYNEIYITNNRGLFKINNNDVEYDLIDSITKVDNTITISIKEAYWKNYNLEPLGKITSDDFIYTFNLIKGNIVGTSYFGNKDDFYNKDTFSHMVEIKKISDNSFSIVLDRFDIDIGYHLNFFPANKEMMDTSHDIVFDYHDMIFADGEYSIDLIDHTYVLKTSNKNYLNEIRIHLNEEDSNSLYPYDEDNDIVDILDLNKDIDYQYDEYVFGYHKPRSMAAFHLTNGDGAPPTYKEAVKSKNFRKALLIFLYNNIDILTHDLMPINHSAQITQTVERFHYYDYIYEGVSYKEEINNITKTPLTIDDSKKYFDLFKKEFDVDLKQYPIELNYLTVKDNEVFDTLNNRIKETFGNSFKLIKKDYDEWSIPNQRQPYNTFFTIDYLESTKPIFFDPADYLNKIVNDMYNPLVH